MKGGRHREARRKVSIVAQRLPCSSKLTFIKQSSSLGAILSTVHGFPFTPQNKPTRQVCYSPLLYVRTLRRRGFICWNEKTSSNWNLATSECPSSMFLLHLHILLSERSHKYFTPVPTKDKPLEARNCALPTPHYLPQSPTTTNFHHSKYLKCRSFHKSVPSLLGMYFSIPVINPSVTSFLQSSPLKHFYLGVKIKFCKLFQRIWQETWNLNVC